ncbi:hypothetical protein E4U14_002071 [Claviceps sp. LM454 group G7]|nr:hypothetical protein E4U14_002071 [Claviceps sp. LM454 group G7]
MLDSAIPSSPRPTSVVPEEAKPRHRPSRTGDREDHRYDHEAAAISRSAKKLLPFITCPSDKQVILSSVQANSQHCIPFASLASNLPCS